MTVDLFIPCFIDQMFPSTGWSVVKTLEKAGVSVNYNPKQTCCGQPAYNSGAWKQARKLGEKFMRDFPLDKPVIVPSASCAGYIRNHYGKLLEENKNWEQYRQQLKKNVIEYTDFLVNHLKFTHFNASFAHTVTYHDGCSALREYGLTKEPRLLLAGVEGLNLVEMQDTTTCCGFGGTFMVKYIPISTAMVEQKVENALKTGATHIISTEASCLINIKSYIEKQKLPLQTVHIADVLASF